eukprot:gene22985-biopygen5793
MSFCSALLCSAALCCPQTTTSTQQHRTTTIQWEPNMQNGAEGAGKLKIGPPPKPGDFGKSLGVARKILQPCVPDASLTRSGRVPDASHATGRYCKLCGKCGKRAAQSAGCGVRGNTSQNLKKRMRPGRVPGVSSAVSPKQGQLPRDRPAFAAAWDKQAPARRVRARPGAVRSARASRPDLLFLP